MFSAIPLGPLTVCWSDGEVDPATKEVIYKKEIGDLMIEPPPPLGSIDLGITTTVKGATAPVLLSFTTSNTPYYATIRNQMRLRISVEYFDKVEIWSADGSHVLLQDKRYNEIFERTQAVCGYIIREAWSNDTSIYDYANQAGRVYDKNDMTSDPYIQEKYIGPFGPESLSSGSFPVPHGCYYTLNNNRFELFIVLEQNNGLKPQTEYQLVLNARFLEQDAVVQVTIFGDLEDDFFKVVELEDVFLDPKKPLVDWNVTDNW